MDSDEDRAEARGFPIRRFTDQSLFAAPRDLSQRTTSFIASRCQGIHQTPLSRLIVLINNAHPDVPREPLVISALVRERMNIRKDQFIPDLSRQKTRSGISEPCAFFQRSDFHLTRKNAFGAVRVTAQF